MNRQVDRPREAERQGTPNAEQAREAALDKIIVEGDAEALVSRAKEIGRALKNARLTMSQIRGVFGAVRQIESRWPKQPPLGDAPQAAKDQDAAWGQQAMRQLLLLQPKLEYQARRQEAVAPLRDELLPAIQRIKDDRERFGRFVEYFEAILAYFVAAGGSTN